MNKIWVRYFLKQIWRIFFLVIFSFYFLYVLIDFSAHSKAFQLASPLEIFLYYVYQFAKRADILLTVTLLISTIKVLTSLNVKNEIVALAASGISLKRLLNPFLFAALLSASCIYLNFQFFQPYSLQKIETFEETYFENFLEDHKKRVHALALTDNSLLLYQFFDSSKQAFFDTYWIRNLDEIYKIQVLFPYEKIPRGQYVDILVRSQNGDISRKSSHESFDFENLHIEKKSKLSELLPPSWQSFSELKSNFSSKELFFGKEKMADREAETAATFFYKLFIPLASFLAVLIPAPFCLKFTRGLPVFILFALSLFGVFAFFTLANCCFILGVSQVLSPFWPIFLIMVVSLFVSGVKYAKL